MHVECVLAVVDSALGVCSSSPLVSAGLYVEPLRLECLMPNTPHHARALSQMTGGGKLVLSSGESYMGPLLRLDNKLQEVSYRRYRHICMHHVRWFVDRLVSCHFFFSTSDYIVVKF